MFIDTQRHRRMRRSEERNSTWRVPVKSSPAPPNGVRLLTCPFL